MDSRDIKEFILSISTQYWYSVLVLNIDTVIDTQNMLPSIKNKFSTFFWGVAPYGGGKHENRKIRNKIS